MHNFNRSKKAAPKFGLLLLFLPKELPKVNNRTMGEFAQIRPNSPNLITLPTIKRASCGDNCAAWRKFCAHAWHYVSSLDRITITFFSF
jgi:hypothetical protein